MIESTDAPGQGSTAEAREFEFDAGQNAVIERLSGTMKFVGVVNLIGAVLYGVSALIHVGLSVAQPTKSNLAMFLVTSSVCALFYFTGRWITHAAGSFKYIVTTTGNDIHNLMSALDDLFKLYRLQKVMIIVMLVVVAISVGLMIAAMSMVTA